MRFLYCVVGARRCRAAFDLMAPDFALRLLLGRTDHGISQAAHVSRNSSPPTLRNRAGRGVDEQRGSFWEHRRVRPSRLQRGGTHAVCDRMGNDTEIKKSVSDENRTAVKTSSPSAGVRIASPA